MVLGVTRGCSQVLEATAVTGPRIRGWIALGEAFCQRFVSEGYFNYPVLFYKMPVRGVKIPTHSNKLEAQEFYIQSIVYRKETKSSILEFKKGKVEEWPESVTVKNL